MKKLVYIILLTVITSILYTGTASAARAGSDLPSGLSADDLESRIDAMVKEHETTTAAVSVTVFSGQDILLEKAYGYTDLEKKLPNDSNAVFEWGSCTKLLTWVSVMQLKEQGKLDLNADIRTYLPKDFFRKLNYDEPITLLNLMNHNAGWQETITDLFIKDAADVKSLGEELKYLEPQQVAPPGERMAYSNWGTALAGYIVERVSGESYDEYVREHIFQPLGMEHTAIRPDLSDNTWVANQRSTQKCYTNTNQSLGASLYHIALYPAGMATGTIGDFVSFTQALLPGEAGITPLFKTTATLKEMLTPSAYYADGTTPRNYHGLWTDFYRVPVLWHNGGTAGSTSWFAFDPVSGAGAVILTNQSDEYTYTCGILPLVFGDYQYQASEATDISGVYVSSRTVFTGFGKLFRLFCITKISPSGNGYQSPGKTYTGLGKNAYVMDMGGAKQFPLFATVNSAGKKVLQIPSEDYLEINPLGLLGEVLLLLLYLISFLYCIITLLIRLIKAVKHHKLVHPAMLSVVDASVVLSVLLSGTMSVQLFSPGALYQSIQWILVLNGICALVPIVYAVYLMVSLRRLACSGRTKAALLIHTCLCLIMTVNIIYWNTYQFW